MVSDIDLTRPKGLRPLIARTDAMRQLLISKYKGGEGMPNAVIGREREIFVTEYLRNAYPSHFRFSSGAIIDKNGNLSGQIDVVVNSPEGPSFPLSDHAEGERLFLADTVAAVVSVKSNINAQWKEVEAEVAKLAPVSRQSDGFVFFTIEPREPSIPFFVVGYRGAATPEGLLKAVSSVAPKGIIKAAMCLESSALCLFNTSSNEYVVCQDDSSFLRFIIALHNRISGSFVFGDPLWGYAVEVQKK
jgi:hypothetical protein